MMTTTCQRRGQEPPAGKPDVEKTDLVDEKQRARFQRVRNAICEQRILFATQGTIVASWKIHAGKRLGPYYRVAYRLDGKQKSLYLGVSEWLVAKVRELLASLQSPFRQYQVMQRLKRQARRAVAESKKRLAELLRATFGAATKGWEFRGVFRALAQHAAQREQDAYDRRAAEARRVIQGEPAATKEIASRKTTCQTQEWLAAA